MATIPTIRIPTRRSANGTHSGEREDAEAVICSADALLARAEVERGRCAHGGRFGVIS